MGAYKYISKAFKEEYKSRSQVLKDRLAIWRSDPTILRIERPTNLARARELGYKAVNGVVIARVRIEKGKSKRRNPAGGRKPSKYGRFFALTKSLQSIAEERASKKFDNCEVLNSYFVGGDGNNKFFEVILLDRMHPSIRSNSEYERVLGQKNRVLRGLTSSGRRHRGIMRKGSSTERNRPSVRKSQGR